MTKNDFLVSFVTQFLASYAATHYDDCCIRGDWAKISDKAPVDDALTLAEDIWESPEFNEVWRNSLKTEA